MEPKELPIMILDPKTQKRLFHKAVSKRYNSLVDGIKKSTNPHLKMKIDFDEFKKIFENPIIDPSLKSQMKILRLQTIGSCKEDPWVQIKDIFLSRLNGKPYDYSLINHDDIELLLNDPSSEIPLLHNQIWTEVHYKYYLYLDEHLKLSVEEKSLSNGPEIELDLTEKMLVISYLQDSGYFPKKNAYQNRKPFDKLLAALFDTNYDNIKKKYGILDNIKRGPLSDAQKRDRTNNLKKALDVIKYLDDKELEKVIQNRINQLSLRIQ